MQHLNQFLDDLTRFPVNLVTDDGKEFFNSEVQSLFLLHGINHYSTPSKSKSKASLAERAIRTIKQRLQKIFYKNKNSRWMNWKIWSQNSIRQRIPL